MTEQQPKRVIVRCCDDCGLSSHSPADGLWFCVHEYARKKGLFINVTRADGKPFKRGVSRRCPLQHHSVIYELAEDVEFID
jgi:hypothetical protein